MLLKKKTLKHIYYGSFNGSHLIILFLSLLHEHKLKGKIHLTS
jgi:hypothetical protein